MAKTLQLKSKPTKSGKDEYFSDSDLTTLITIIINENPQFQNIQKGVWLWNCTDNKFLCSGTFTASIKNATPESEKQEKS